MDKFDASAGPSLLHRVQTGPGRSGRTGGCLSRRTWGKLESFTRGGELRWHAHRSQERFRTPLRSSQTDERRTTRTRFVREAGVAALGLTALGRFATPARGAARTEDRRRRCRPRRAECRVLAAQCRLQRRDPRGVRPDRRALLDSPRRVRRGPDRRARRRADRPGPHRDPATRIRSRPEAGQPPQGRAERNGGARLLRQVAVHLRGDDRRHQGRVAEDPQRRLRRELPDHVRDLDRERPRARQHVDRRLDRGDLRGRDEIADRAAARRRVQHRVRRRIVRAERAQPALPARLLGVRASSASSAPRTRSTTSSAATTRSPIDSPPASQARSRRAPSSSR